MKKVNLYKKRMVFVGVLSLIVLFISIIGLYFYNGGYDRIPKSAYKNQQETKNEILLNENYSIKDRIKFYLDKDIDNVSIIYKDLNTNETIKINQNEEFLAASTYKVGLNLYAYDLVKKGNINLTDKVPYKKDHYEEGAGTLQFKEDLIEEELQYLLDLSISHSDNIASNMISDYLGGKETVRAALNDIYKTNMPIDENIISPKDELKILEYVYKNSNDENIRHLSEVMKNTIYNSRLNRYLHEGITAHKVGTYDTSIHDVGIIYDDNPYILIIYTKDLVEDVTVDCTNGETVIADISKAIYQYHKNKYN